MVHVQPETQDSAARNDWFSTTHWSIVLQAQADSSPDAARALDALCRTYWVPLYSYVRQQGHSPHDAQDLTQEFFARFVGKDYLASVGREKGKFRSFLLKALNHFLADQRDRARAIKRGGGQTPVPLTEDEAERLYLANPGAGLAPDEAFEKRWATALLSEAFAKLQAESVAAGKGDRFERLKGFLEDGTDSGDYETLGAEMGLAANTIAASVHRLRQRYRELVRIEIANTVATPGEIQEEMRYLFAVLTR